MCKKTIALIILCCFLCLQVHVGVVKGRYLLQVTIGGYTNRFQRCGGCASGRCCDTDFTTNDCSGERRCDIFFFFCLRPFGSNGEGCSYSGDLTSEINEDDATISFNEMKFLGLDNPLTLEGLTDAWNGVQVYIEARDQDENDQYELINIWRINNDLSVGALSMTQVFTGVHGTMSLTVRGIVLCAENFTGSDCTQCIRGLTGSMCNENINDCLGRTCTGNRRCVDGLDTYTCECNPGFTGAECMDNINECAGVNCSGNGECVDGIDSYSCNCSAGYNGTDCEINIDECLWNPCGPNGECIDGVDSFTCNCATGYTGTLCDSDIDECLSGNPCGRNGQCENQEGSFTCNCATGYTGALCDSDIDECLSNPCGRNGQCENQEGSFNCSCNPGFTGDFCQTNIEIQGSSIQAGPIVGGALGGLIALILILTIIMVAVVLTVRCLSREGKEHPQGRRAYSDALPGDNPVYDRGNTAVTFGGLTQTSAPVHYTNLSSSNGNQTAESAPDRVFDNPIYGGNDDETEDTYADPDANHLAGTGMGSSPYHKFDNPIYGGEADENSTYALLADDSSTDHENAYSMLADSSTVNGTAASTGQAVYANAKRGTHAAAGNEQVYHHVN